MRCNTAGCSPNSRRKNPLWSSFTLHRLDAPRSLPTLEHLITLSDDVGVIQHAVEDVPNRSTGYCTDDVSRAFIVVLKKLEIDPNDTMAERLAPIYLAFLHDAQLDDGRFHNFMGYDRQWLDAVGTHDSVGRAIWSLGYGMRYAMRASWQRTSKKLLDKSLASIDWLTYPRSQAYAAIGLAHAADSPAAGEERPQYLRYLRTLGDALKARYLEVRDAGWQWFENAMTYDNARLPEAILRAGMALRDDELIAIGLRTFDFHERVTMEDGVYVPVGNNGWYQRGGVKPRYSQQPLEAVAMIDAALVALDATGDPAYRTTANAALEWYYGKNSRGIDRKSVV